MRYPIPVTLAAALAASLSGCASVTSDLNEVKADVVTPAPDAGFIQDPERETKRADLPFQKVWVESGVDFKHYRELIVAPVNTQHMLKMDWLHKMSSAEWLGSVNADIKELARYFHDQVVKDFQQDPHHRFQVIDEAAQRRQPTLRLELALVEIDPSEPVLHALGWLEPGGGTAAGIINQRRAAFEARLRDMQTAEVIATFADRDMQDVGPLDLTRLTWYGPAKDIMDRWAHQFVQVANRKPGEMVTDSVPFTLRPF